MVGNHFQNLGWFLVLGRGAFSDKGLRYLCSHFSKLNFGVGMLERALFFHVFETRKGKCLPPLA